MNKIGILLVIGLLGFHISAGSHSNNNSFVDNEIDKFKPKGVTTHVTLTCYHPVESQCDSDPLITADGSKIDLNKLKNKEIKWCAISRDLLWLFPKDKPKKVFIEGYGIYEVRDVMNRRWEHRLDILKHPSDKKLIMDKNVKVIILS